MQHKKADVRAKASQALRQVVANESNSGWDSALLALAKEGDYEIFDPAVRVLNNQNNEWYIRMVAARALGDLGNRYAIEALSAAASDSNASVRAQASASLTILKSITSPCLSCLHPNPFGAKKCESCGRSFMASWEQ